MLTLRQAEGLFNQGNQSHKSASFRKGYQV